jgi:hypothetical protein
VNTAKLIVVDRYHPCLWYSSKLGLGSQQNGALDLFTYVSSIEKKTSLGGTAVSRMRNYTGIFQHITNQTVHDDVTMTYFTRRSRSHSIVTLQMRSCMRAWLLWDDSGECFDPAGMVLWLFVLLAPPTAF